MKRQVFVVLLCFTLLGVACTQEETEPISSNEEVVTEVEEIEEEPEEKLEEETKEEPEEELEEESEEEPEEEPEDRRVFLADLTAGDGLEGLIIKEVSQSSDDFYIEVEGDYQVEGTLSYGDFAGATLSVSQVKGDKTSVFVDSDAIQNPYEIHLPFLGLISLTQGQVESINKQLGMDLYDFFSDHPDAEIPFTADFTGAAVAGILPGEVRGTYIGDQIDLNEEDLPDLTQDGKQYLKDLEEGDALGDLLVKEVDLTEEDFLIEVEGDYYVEGRLVFDDFMGGVSYQVDHMEGSEQSVFIEDDYSDMPFELKVPSRYAVTLTEDQVRVVNQQLGEDIFEFLLNNPEEELAFTAQFTGHRIAGMLPGENFSSFIGQDIQLDVDQESKSDPESKPEGQTDGLTQHLANQEEVVFPGSGSETRVYLDSEKGSLINQETGYELELGISSEMSYFYSIDYYDSSLVSQVKPLLALVDYGPSMDYTTRLYEIENGVFQFFGSVPGQVVDQVENKNYDTSYLPGIGFEAPVKLYNLPSNVWFGRTTFAFIDYEFQPISDTYMTDFIVTVLETVDLDTVNGETVTLSEGQRLKYIQSSGSDYETSEISVIDADTKAALGSFYSKDLKREYFDGYRVFD